MTEQELRGLIRQAIAHHLGRRDATAPMLDSAVAPPRAHPSHALFVLPAEPGEACVIEPAVTCNHCGFCKSYGH